MDQGKRYRLTLFGRPVAPWRLSSTDARDDAILQRLGSRDPWDRVTYLGVGVEVQVAAPSAETEHDLAHAAHELREVADLAGRAGGARLKVVRRPKTPHTEIRRSRSSTG